MKMAEDLVEVFPLLYASMQRWIRNTPKETIARSLNSLWRKELYIPSVHGPLRGEGDEGSASEHSMTVLERRIASEVSTASSTISTTSSAISATPVSSSVVPIGSTSLTTTPDRLTLTIQDAVDRAIASAITVRRSDTHVEEILPSALLGARGEEMVSQILTRDFQTIENVSATRHTADLMVDRQVLVEVKNYSRTVPSTEIEKFHRDLYERATPGGVFISIRSGVAKHKVLQFEELVNDGMRYMVAYLTLSADMWDTDQAGILISSVVNFIKESCRIIRWRMDGEQYEQLYAYMEEMNIAVEQLVSARAELATMRNAIINGFDEISSLLSVNLVTLKRRMARIMEHVMEVRTPVIECSDTSIVAVCHKNKDLLTSLLSELTPSDGPSLDWSLISGRTPRAECVQLPFLKFDFFKIRTDVNILMTPARSSLLLAEGVDWNAMMVKKGYLIIPLKGMYYDLILALCRV